MTTESELAQAQGDILALQTELDGIHDKIGNLQNDNVKLQNRVQQQDAAIRELGGNLPNPPREPAKPVEPTPTRDLVADGEVNNPDQMSLPVVDRDAPVSKAEKRRRAALTNPTGA